MSAPPGWRPGRTSTSGCARTARSSIRASSSRCGRAPSRAGTCRPSRTRWASLQRGWPRSRSASQRPDGAARGARFLTPRGAHGTASASCPRSNKPLADAVLPRHTCLVIKLVVGILKGAVIGGAVGYGAYALARATGFGSPWFTYGVVGALVGLIAGRPIWSLIRDKNATTWVSILKAAFGFGVGCGLYALISKAWNPSAVAVTLGNQSFDIFTWPVTLGNQSF